MIRKKLFTLVKSAAAIAVLTVTTGATVAGGAGINLSGLLTPTTAYAFDHQSYADSTGYSLRLDGDIWHCYNADGQIDYNYDGLAENEYGWWKVNNGEVDFNYDGLADNQYGTWKITGGKADFDCNGVVYDGADWIKCTGGKVDTEFNGLSYNEYGWWKLADGVVDFDFTGYTSNEYGTWKIVGGKVDFDCNGLDFDGTDWIKVTGGMVDTDFTGIAANEYGSWKVTNGKVDFNFNGVEFNGTDWVKCTGGRVDNSFTGIADNEYGSWKVTDGKVDFGCTDTYEYNGVIYVVTGGYAVVEKSTESTQPEYIKQEQEYANVYDYEYYKANNTDIADTYGDDRARYIEHFVNYGMAEGRTASENFNVRIYRLENDDLRQMYGDNLVEYYNHYNNYGVNENRNAIKITKSTEFSVDDAWEKGVEVYGACSEDDYKILNSLCNRLMTQKEIVRAYNNYCVKSLLVSLDTYPIRSFSKYMAACGIINDKVYAGDRFGKYNLTWQVTVIDGEYLYTSISTECSTGDIDGYCLLTETEMCEKLNETYQGYKFYINK